MFTGVKPVPPLPSHSSVQDLTERFSAYFTDKIANLRRDLPNCPVPSPAASIIQPCNCSLAKFSEVIPKVVRETIDKSPSKSCLSDPIPTRTFKSSLDDLLPVITSLVNSSLREGIFPNAFKEGRLLPKIKKISLNKEDLNNYRPITNLTFVSKVIESYRIIYIRSYKQQTNSPIARRRPFYGYKMIFSELSIIRTRSFWSCWISLLRSTPSIMTFSSIDYVHSLVSLVLPFSGSSHTSEIAPRR